MFKIFFLLVSLKAVHGETSNFYRLYPPPDIIVSNIKNDTVDITWTPTKISDYIHHLQINDSQNAIICSTKIPTDRKFNFTLVHLKAGETYGLEMCEYDLTTKKTIDCESKLQYFTTRPNPPEKFTSISSSENEITINWLPPSIPCLFTHYQASIEPFDGTKSISHRQQAIFNDLFPGRLYNVAIKTVSHYETSVPIKTSCRTKPMPPFNLTIDFSLVTPTSFCINWNDPIIKTEFDVYEISLRKRQSKNTLFIKSFNSISLKRDIHSWEFKNLEPRGVYRAIVQTVSGGVYSQSAYRDILLEPILL